MRTIIILETVFIFGGCNDTGSSEKSGILPPDSKTVTVELIDSMGILTFSIPNRYDTFFQWTNHSDCGKPCAKEQYRFQPKTLPVTKESGFVWLGEPQDSVERFTIIHSGYTPFQNNTTMGVIEMYHKNKKKEMLSDPLTNNIKSDTIEKINDKLFSIIVADHYDQNKLQYSKKIFAATTMKTNIIEFKYELLTKKNDSLSLKFIARSTDFLKTMRIKENRVLVTP